jgi:hypothetical protein
MLLGAAVGVVLAIAMLMGIRVNGVPLIVAVGLGKLTFITALGLMGAGAFLRRLGIRREQRNAPEREPV